MMNKLKIALVFAMILSSGYLAAQNTPPNVSFINPATVPAPKGYSQAAVIDLGSCKMVIISGQVALDTKGNLVGKDNFEQQTNQVFLNIKNIVEAAGGDMGDLVKIQYYLLDVGELKTVRAVRDKYISVANLPASTLVQVSKLFRDDVLLEIDATAIIPNRK